MAVVLVILGVLGVAAGAAMVGFGVPVKEFSLGNTLIMAGTTAMAGGLIVVGLGIVARRLQVVADLLAMRAPALQPGRPGELPPGLIPTPPRPPAAGRVPFPPRREVKAKPEVRPEVRPDLRPEPPLAAAATPVSATTLSATALSATPLPATPLPPEPIERDVFRAMLRDEPPVPPELEDAAPPVGMEPAPQDVPPQGVPSVDLPPPEPPLPEPLRRDAAAPSVVFAGSSFEAIWRDEPAPPPAVPAEPAHAAETVRRVATPSAPPVTPVHLPAEPRALAILKSGVVDGMGYTLYTDGSIEAELPQGTARFASIAELREHLEKNTAKVPGAD